MNNYPMYNRYWCCGLVIGSWHHEECPIMETENRCPVCHVHTQCEHGEWSETLKENR